MKVSIKVTVDLNRDDWARFVMLDDLATPADVRRDVKDYFASQISQAPAVEDANLTLVVA